LNGSKNNFTEKGDITLR